MRNYMRRAAIADRADDRPARDELALFRRHDALHMGVHRVEAAAVVENQRAALVRPGPDRAIGGGAHRGAACSAAGIHQVERVAIPAIVRPAAVTLDDLPGFARRRWHRKLWRGLVNT